MIPTDYVDQFVTAMAPGSIEVSDVVFAALGCGASKAHELVHGLPDAHVSHDNCVHQSVICAHPDSMAVALERAKAEKVFAQELPFRSGFHSPLFEPFVANLVAQFASLPLQGPAIPMWSATTCAPYPSDRDGIAELAVHHLGMAGEVQVAVEPRHYAVVDLSAETRIPGVGYHSIEVESDRPVVVARTTTLSAGPDPATDAGIAIRPALGRGVALSTGTPVLARSWTVPSINAGADPAPVVAVHNPGEGIARVTLEVVAAGSSTALPGATDLEVAPGDSAVVPLGPAVAPEVAIVVTSSEPVAVERITVYAPDVDLAFDPAVPGHGRNRPLVALGSS